MTHERTQMDARTGGAALEALLADARAEGWTFVKEALPEAGARVEVMHLLNRSYDTDGEIDASGRWHCRNGFILPGMIFTLSPTHWRARATERTDHEG